MKAIDRFGGNYREGHVPVLMWHHGSVRQGNKSVSRWSKGKKVPFVGNQHHWDRVWGEKTASQTSLLMRVCFDSASYTESPQNIGVIDVVRTGLHKKVVWGHVLFADPIILFPEFQRLSTSCELALAHYYHKRWQPMDTLPEAVRLRDVSTPPTWIGLLRRLKDRHSSYRWYWTILKFF